MSYVSFTKKNICGYKNVTYCGQSFNLFIFSQSQATFVRARGTFFEVGVLKKLDRSERSERSANRRGVQGPAVGPLVGSRGNGPGGGPGGEAPGSSEVSDI